MSTALHELSATPAPTGPAVDPPRRRSRARAACAAALALLLGFALVGPLVLGDPAAQDLSRFLEPPSRGEPLGTDDYGRSVLTRLAHATRLSLVLAALASGGSLVAIYVGIALAQWVEYFRVVRARAGLVLGSPAVETAGLLGLGRVHVVRRHLLPDLRPLLSTLASLGMVTSVLAMSTLGFVKVGLEPPRAELGLMITESFPFYDVAPWMVLGPVGVLFVLTVSLLGLRDGEDAA